MNDIRAATAGISSNLSTRPASRYDGQTVPAANESGFALSCLLSLIRRLCCSMRCCIPFILTALIAGKLPAAPVEDARASQALAATAGAMLRLEDDINDEKLGPRL